jgi:hypothetical protein
MTPPRDWHYVLGWVSLVLWSAVIAGVVLVMS